MKKIISIIIVLLLSVNTFPQECDDKKTLEPDVMGSLSEATGPGWVFWPETSDEFNELTLDRNKWDVAGQDGLFCHGMSPYAYFKDNDTSVVRVKNGRLILKCKPDMPYLCEGQYHTYSSGYIKSKELYLGGTFFHYGLIQLKCKFPNEVGLEPCFWTTGGEYSGGFMTRYDEIDVIEKNLNLPSNYIFRQSLWRWIFLNPPPSQERHADGEFKHLEYPSPYTGTDFVITVEWLPTEINFYMNGHWTNTYKYTNDPSSLSLSDYPGPRSEFTCVDFTYACKQGIQLSLSLTSNNPVNLAEGFEVDWIRSYKLVPGESTYWPDFVLLSDAELTKVHSTITFGGTSHNGEIPANSNIRIWASNSITMDKGFTLQPNCIFEMRRIDTDPDLFTGNIIGNGEE
ncbi:MAG: family 16 glycosylhydrolase [Bacteroidota bacterium]